MTKANRNGAKAGQNGGSQRRSTTRCAIYTRKSSEEGLEQAFNSLDAQREACEAFILSQKSEGWIALPQMYDDGGISGGTMDRPALSRLLADIAARRVDTVVVYKVDRLTRSLSDFARIVEVFDQANVSFVSVTQQFNTTTSMGRLTLNMLLSFAQFERDVTGERIRDKIAASKRKGMWMGGIPPLGYDIADRKLVVNAAEAATVRMIFECYAISGSVRLLQAELDRDGIISKKRVNRFGQASGGQGLERGALYRILQNRLYRGEVAHKGQVFEGEHDPIIDAELWGRVQRLLSDHRVDRENGVHALEPSLLTGLLVDGAGVRMTPSHAVKKGTRYRYYVSQNLILGTRKVGPIDANDAKDDATHANAGHEHGRRIPAADLEHLVQDRILQFLRDEPELHAALDGTVTDIGQRARCTHEAGQLAATWSELDGPGRRAHLRRLVDCITVGDTNIEIAIRPRAIAAVAPLDPNSLVGDSRTDATDETRATDAPLLLVVPAKLKRVGVEMKLLIDAPGTNPKREPDRSMLRLLAQAERFHSRLMAEGLQKTFTQMAEEEGVTLSYFTRTLRLSFLAPDITATILDDRHPKELTARRLSLDTELPLGWGAQKALLGIA